MTAINLGTGVTPGSDASLKMETAGAAILAGQAVYKKASDGRVYLASTASSEAAGMVGIAMGSAPTIGQQIVIQWDGTVENTATLVLGDVLVVSDTAGSLGPVADLGTGDWVTIGGGAVATTKLKLRILQLGVQHA